MKNQQVREKVNLLILKDDCAESVVEIEKGNLFICQFSDGTCFGVNNNGINGKYKGVMYNPKSQNVTTFELHKKEFIHMYKEVSSLKGNLYYMIENNGHDMTNCFNQVTDALMAMKSKTNSFNGYNVRKI